MGLDTSHEAYYGGYISFSIWRNLVAKAAGVRPGTDVRYQAHSFLISPDWPDETVDRLNGEWTEDPEDVLAVLMVHYDTEGIIPTRFCAPLADRLESLRDKLEPDQASESLGGHDRWKSINDQFVAGLRLAASLGEDVEFH